MSHSHSPIGRWRAGGAAILSGILMLAASLAGPASAASPAPEGSATHTLVAVNGDLGTYLTGDGGMTLYYFAKDTAPGVSVCEGKCAEFWPPLLLGDGESVAAGDGVSGVVGSFTRPDGTTQVSYDGRPLYYFATDAKAGDVTGQDVGEVWFVAAVDGSMPPAPVYTIATATTAAGPVLTGEDGMTLYFFANDTAPGVSTCAGDCLANWPPVLNGGRDVFVAGDGVTGVLALASGEDGSEQLTYDGRPLYYFAGDQAAGDVTGQGIGGVWFAATVDGSLPTP